MMKKENRIAWMNGIAIFAMFFGSGNLIFPLALGSTAAHHFFPVWIAFLLTGVGLPFMGVFTITLFKGNYWKFFETLTRPVALFVITFILLIIAPLFAAPRTETVTYGSFAALFPNHLISAPAFSLVYFVIVFLIALSRSHFMEIVGKVLGPVKIMTFLFLIVTALFVSHQTYFHIDTSAYHQVSNALTIGYNTMDLLAAVFFGSVVYQNVFRRCKKEGIDFNEKGKSITLKSCFIGGSLLALIYTGFMLSAWLHAGHLQGVPTVSIMSALSLIVFGQNGALFVAFCIGLTCIVTASALVEVFSHYLETIIFRNRFPRLACVILTVVWMYAMSLLGFDRIIALASPILNYLYPMLIAYCIFQLFRLAKKRKSS